MKTGILLQVAALAGLLALSSGPLGGSAAWAEPADGISRCGADGYVERYSTLGHAWEQTATRCRGGGDEPRGRSDGDEPQNGISRCGADGYVERYSTLGHTWEQTAQKCR